MTVLGGTSNYNDTYDYAEQAQESNAPVDGSRDLGDPSAAEMQEGDLYTEVFEESYYVEEEYGDGKLMEGPQAGAADAQAVGEMAGDAPEAEVVAALRKQMDELKKKIGDSEDPEAQKGEMGAQLERARASLDISPESFPSASETYLSVQESFDQLSQYAPAALEISSQLGKDIAEVEGAAKEAGLSLDKLPNPPDERVMQFLISMGIPGDQKAEQFRILKDQRTANMKATKGSLVTQSQVKDADGNLPLDKNDLNLTEAYRTLQDPEYQQMMGVVSELRSPILQGLKAMGYPATAGERADQINVGGSQLDFFDENTSGLTFSTQETTLTQNPNDLFVVPEPGDTDAHPGWDATGRVVGGIVGGSIGCALGTMSFIPGAGLLGLGVGAAVGQEIGHQLVQGAHDLLGWF